MTAIRIVHAQPEDAMLVADMVGSLLNEIMEAVKEKVFAFDRQKTAERADRWIQDGRYTVRLARSADQAGAVAFLALCEGYALYTDGAFGIIPEFYVCPAYRSRGVGSALLAEAVRVGEDKGWRRLEVTTPPLPQFDRTLSFYSRQGFTISGGQKLKLTLGS